MNRRAFASCRCPHCGFWLVGSEENSEWFCTVCGCKIADDFLISSMKLKADYKEITDNCNEPLFFDECNESRGLGVPQKGNAVPVESVTGLERWKDEAWRKEYFALVGHTFSLFGGSKCGVSKTRNVIKR